MIILHFSTGKQWRGGEQQIAYTVEYLSSNVQSVLVCQPGSPLMHKLQGQKTICIGLKVRNSLDIGAILGFRNLIKTHQPDLIHLHDSKAHTIAVFTCWIYGLKTPMILTRRVLFNMSNGFISRWKYNYINIRKVIAVSDAIKNKLEAIPIPREKLQTIYSGTKIKLIDIHQKKIARANLIEQFNLNKSIFIIGNVAALTEEKDLITFIKSAKKVTEVNASVIFLSFGKGPMKRQLEKKISELGLSKNVILTGFQENILELIPGLDLLVSTSTAEGLGTNLLDGMLAGVPVIATDVGGIPEIIQDEINGRLFHPGDADLLANEILELINNDSERNKYVENGLQSIVKFDIHKNILKLESAYNDCIL